MKTFSHQQSGVSCLIRGSGLASVVMTLVCQSALAVDPCPSTPVPLAQATATFSQTCGGGGPVSRMIDGNPATGWAIYESPCSTTVERSFDQTAVAETVSDLVSPVPGQPFVIDVSVFSGFNSGTSVPHALGLFRISVTGDDRSTFADGLSAGGDVSANWIVLTPYSAIAQATSSAGVPNSNPAATLTVQPDSSVLASGALPEYNRYRILAVSPLTAVTGVRIEVIDANGTSSAAALGMPTGGPGRASNGNFILFEMSMGAGRCIDICSQPEAMITCPGGDAMFMVTAGGIGPFTYQWRLDGTPIDTMANPSAATAMLMVSGAEASGSYDCIVTNACSSVTSSAAELTVCPADFNCDGSADFFDYLDFVDAFSSLDPGADFNGDEAIDFFDYLDFVDAFSTGC